MRSVDYVLNMLTLQWVHPETGVTINVEDMPWELVPDTIRVVGEP